MEMGIDGNGATLRYAATETIGKIGGMEAQMEEVWKQLPEELQLKLVDDHLPLEAQCRLRSVSKAWKSPRLRPGALRGLYIHRDICDQRGSLHLYNKKIGKKNIILLQGSFWLNYADCVNGLVGAVAATSKDFLLKNQVVYSVFNVFRPGPGWEPLPRPPPAPGRACVLAALSKKLGDVEPPRIGMSKLEDYIFMVGMGNHKGAKVGATSLLLQVYSDGEWGGGLVELPPGHYFMFCYLAIHFRNGVLRGSEFFFLTMHSTNTAVSLCCVDVLAEHKSCKVLCGLSRELVSSWNFSSTKHSKLAICSGKLWLVHKIDLPGEDWTLGVQLLDEEKLRWKFICSLPPTVKTKPDLNIFYQILVTFGGDELVMYDGHGTGYIYNVVTGSWSTTTENLFPIS